MCDGEGPQFEGGFPDLSELFGGLGGMFGGMGGQMGGIPGMGGQMGGIPGMGGMFGNMGFSGNMGQREKPKPVEKITVKITLEEIFNGAEKVVEIQSSDKCGDCAGTGSTDRKKPTCQECKGQGMRTVIRQIGPNMMQQATMPCNACNQKGVVIDKTKQCGKCKGKGSISNLIKKTITIKKNFDYQTKMHLRNVGNYDTDSESNADVFILYKLTDCEKHKLSVVNNYDLLYECDINIWDAFTGYSMYFYHPDKVNYIFKVDDVIKHGDIKYINNVGLPCSDNNSSSLSRGKFIVKFNYIYPKNIMDSETLTNWLKNKDKTTVDSKIQYKKEKVHSVQEDPRQSNQFHQSQNEDDDEESQDRHGQNQGQGCQTQ
jgi:DnaJ family protein A protein 2